MSCMNFRALQILGLAGIALGGAGMQAAHAQCAPFSRQIGVELCNAKLSDMELSKLRGGFQFAPGVTAYFAFSQIVKVNGETVQSIVVPQIALSAVNPGANFTITGSAGTTALSGNGTVPLTPSGNGNRSATVGSSSLNGALSVVTSANNGLTHIMSQFSGNGITSNVANTANDTGISTATQISLATQGLQSAIQAQRAAGIIFNNMQH